ncbi:MAG: bifunctional folylpolyglutamate synthase/dihydrofolate synthase [Solobacterium sp.]|nr:bifunctional folylpolyglutamate synthase/dihydrofolate synthase [Solobacterium sp.]
MFSKAIDAENYVMNRHGKGVGLARFREILEEYGNPQDAVPAIHVAGTNGKGSTCNYLKDIYRALGYRTGLFTSPHLDEHRDRIRIDDVWIPEVRYLEYVNALYERIEQEGLSMFECVTLIGFLYFRDEKVDLAVIETGLGGLLDMTNALNHPLISVITTIGYDHMNVLGDTLAEIAAQKAGIIKENGKVMIGDLVPEAVPVIRETAALKQAQFLQMKEFTDLPGSALMLDGMVYTLASNAQYQKKNAVLALSAAEALGVDIHDPRVVDAVGGSLWKGRFETVCRNPYIIMDGAHNEEGMTALVQSVHSLPRPVTCVFTALRDKQGPLMAAMLGENVDRLIVTEIPFYRADSGEHLCPEEGTVIPDYRDAIDLAVRECGDGSVLICGSLYFVSFAREHLKERGLLKPENK